MFPQLQLLRRKPSSPARKPKGFTLIELLVGIMISSVIIMPLLGLVDSLLREDRQEQVKTRSQQELTAALDYIARDMQEAVYIYDQTGVNAIASKLPSVTGGTPVLVFWKRRFLRRDSEIDHDKNSATPQIKVGCLEKFSQKVTNKNQNPPGYNDNCPGGYEGTNQDYSVFSLVVYYLIDNGSSSTWAPNAMRIARWEVSGGVSTDPSKKDNQPYTPLKRDSIDYLALPDKGFQLFDLKNNTGTLAQKMDAWQKHSEVYDLTQNQIVTLVDYIDASSVSTSANLTPSCPATTSPNPTTPNPTNQVVPASAVTGTGSFYACVPQASRSATSNTKDSRPIAQVFIRGNSLLRMEPDPNNAQYSDGKKAYFPTTSIRVQGIGLIGTN